MAENSTSYIDDVMGFDPSSMDAFNEPEKTDYNKNIYKTSPNDSKSDDGRYHSKIRIIYNPFNFKKSIIEQVTYGMYDHDGFFLVRSKLANGDKNCPIFKAWKKLWFSNDENKKNWSKEMFNKNQSKYALIQVIEDENQPDKVGKFLAMKLPKAIWDKMSEKMHPTDGSTPQKLMDYLVGPILKMNVAPGPADDPKRTSYNVCEFDSDPTPITKIDGSPLFSDEEIEFIETYDKAIKDSMKAKTEAKKQAANKIINDSLPKIKELYQRSIDYVRENAFDLEEEIAYHEWDEETTKRVNNWIDLVSKMIDPKTAESSPVIEPTVNNTQDTNDVLESMMSDTDTPDESNDDLPF